MRRRLGVRLLLTPGKRQYLPRISPVPSPFLALWGMVAALQTRGAAFRVTDADRNECVGFQIGVGENPGTVPGEVRWRANTELGSVSGRREHAGQ